MADERTRVEVAQALAEHFGSAVTAALLEGIPPFGWHELATKQDLTHLESRMDAKFDALRFELRGELREFRSELHGEIAELRSEMVGEIAELRSEIAELRSEMVGEIAGLRGEMVGEIAGLRGEMVGEIAGLRGEIAGLRGEIAGLRGEMVGEIGGLRGELLADYRAETNRMLRWIVPTIFAGITAMSGFLALSHALS